MFGHSPIESDRDRRVKVYADNTAVSASTAQSEYARYLNFIGDRFTAVSNTVSGVKTYDIALKYADRIIPYEGGVAQGVTPGYLNFDDTHFDVSSISGGMYTVTNTAYGQVFVNAFTTPHKLSIANATNNEAVTITEDNPNDEADLVFSNDETNIYSNGTLVGTAPRAPNFSTDFTLTDDSANDRVNIALANSGFLPNPLLGKKWGMFYGPQSTLVGSSFGDGLWNSVYSGDSGSANGIISSTHGVGRRYVTGGSDDDLIECQIDTPITRLAFNPHLYFKISGATIDDSRFFCGFHTGTISTGSNTYLNDKSGFALTYQYDTAETEDTVWNINRNDGSGTEQKVSLGVNLTDTAVFTVELVGDTANNRWGWNLNGGAFTYYTQGASGNTPATTTDLGFTFRIEQIGSGATTMDFYYGYWTQDL